MAAPSSRAMIRASDVLPSPGRARQQHVVERVAPAVGAVDVGAEVVAVGIVADEVGEPLGAERAVVRQALGVERARRGHAPAPDWRRPRAARTVRMSAGASASGARRSALSSAASISVSRKPSSARASRARRRASSVALGAGAAAVRWSGIFPCSSLTMTEGGFPPDAGGGLEGLGVLVEDGADRAVEADGVEDGDGDRGADAVDADEEEEHGLFGGPVEAVGG